MEKIIGNSVTSNLVVNNLEIIISATELEKNIRQKVSIWIDILFLPDKTQKSKIEKFLDIIQKHNVITFHDIISAFVYLKKIIYNPNLLENRDFYHKFVIAVMLACKFNEDTPYNNESYNRLSGISLSIINDMELSFLFACNWEVVISQNEYEHVCELLLFIEINKTCVNN